MKEDKFPPLTTKCVHMYSVQCIVAMMYCIHVSTYEMLLPAAMSILRDSNSFTMCGIDLNLKIYKKQVSSMHNRYYKNI